MNSRISLNGSDWLFKDFHGEDWRLRNAHAPETQDTPGWRTGSVPGCPHHDLWKLGEIPDPYVDRNSLLIEWIPQRTWLYKKSFVPDQNLKGQRIQIHFEGVDYQAEFFLNGKSLGSHTGMFTPAIFDVTDELHYGSVNLLAVVIDAAPLEQPQVSRTSRVSTLKTRMNYWWDFCPRMIHLGIWEDVYLEITGPVSIADVFIRPQLSAGFHHADVSISTELDTAYPTDIELEITLRYDGRVVAHQRTHHTLPAGRTNLASRIEVPEPHLWWPNGYGEPELYDAEVRVVRPCADQTMPEDVSCARLIPFGIRQIELVSNESADPSALPYTFVVNGRRIYIKGWNWVPMDALYGVPQPARLERLLTLVKRAHVNLLRVWGGGLIEKKSFYDQCDRLGILVWQEFIQSSSAIDNIPSTSPEYIQMVKDAAEQIIPRKRNHPSLVVWCGGNELSGEAVQPLDDSHPVLGALKSVVKRLDPDRFWFPASPSGPVFMNSLDTIARDPSALHDVHGPWEYQGVTKQYELYNHGASLFHSEFGVEGITNVRTLHATISRECRQPVSLDNPTWFHRGAWWVKRPIWDETFGELHDVETLVRATQFMQADGLRYALEADRRRKYHNSGTLPWQFNEPYPMAACTSAVDYFARPKPAYYATARAYAPLLVSARFKSLVWATDEQFEAEIWASNSYQQPCSDVTLRTRLIGVNGITYIEQTETVSFAADCSARLAAFRGALSHIPEKVFFLDLQLLDSTGALLCQNRYMFSRTENLSPLLALPPAALSISAMESNTEDEHCLTLTNSSSSTTLLIWLEDNRPINASGYVYFDDNYFSLFPGESRNVKVIWRDVPAQEQQLLLSSWNTEPMLLAPFSSGE